MSFLINFFIWYIVIEYLYEESVRENEDGQID